MPVLIKLCEDLTVELTYAPACEPPEMRFWFRRWRDTVVCDGLGLKLRGKQWGTYYFDVAVVGNFTHHTQDTLEVRQLREECQRELVEYLRKHPATYAKLCVRAKKAGLRHYLKELETERGYIHSELKPLMADARNNLAKIRATYKELRAL